MSARILLIDNYDSFTYNLVQAFLVLGAVVEVHRNDEITVAQAQRLAPTHLCISPGPGDSTTASGPRAFASSRVMASCRTTLTGAPSVSKACTRL